MKIPFSALRQCCSENPERLSLSEPWITKNGRTPVLQATDGTILVECPLDEISDMPQLWRRSPLLDPPPSSPLIEAQWMQEVEHYPITDLPQISAQEQTCPGCVGEGSMPCTCPHCDEELHACGACEGSGAIEVFDPPKLQIHGVDFHSRQAVILSRLPALRVGYPLRPGVGAPFQFGENGRGVWMPLLDPDKQPQPS